MMSEQAFTLTIKPAEDTQLDLLEKEFSPHNLSKSHYKRYAVQKRGEGVYLIAWHDHVPIGHFLLRWSGPDDARVMKYIDVTHSAFLEAGATSVAYRRKGVATALIREAERVARAI
jgi:GNAT superfamily N-acetyltransferase